MATAIGGLFGGLTGAAGGGLNALQIGLGLVSDIASASAQASAADAQAAHQQRLSEQRRDENYEKQVVQRQEQAMESEKVAREKRKAQLEKRASIATAVTSAAESGVGGLSVDALIRDYNVQSSMQLEALERQRQFDEIVTEQNVENIAKNVYIPSPVESPSLGTAFLGAAGSLIGSFGSASAAPQPAPTSFQPSSDPFAGVG